MIDTRPDYPPEFDEPEDPAELIDWWFREGRKQYRIYVRPSGKIMLTSQRTPYETLVGDFPTALAAIEKAKELSDG